MKPYSSLATTEPHHYPIHLLDEVVFYSVLGEQQHRHYLP